MCAVTKFGADDGFAGQSACVSSETRACSWSSFNREIGRASVSPVRVLAVVGSGSLHANPGLVRTCGFDVGRGNFRHLGYPPWARPVELDIQKSLSWPFPMGVPGFSVFQIRLASLFDLLFSLSSSCPRFLGPPFPDANPECLAFLPV